MEGKVMLEVDERVREVATSLVDSVVEGPMELEVVDTLAKKAGKMEEDLFVFLAQASHSLRKILFNIIYNR